MESAGLPARSAVTLTVRRMTASDAAGAWAVLNQSPQAALWSETSIAQIVNDGIGWVTERDGRIAGFLIGRAVVGEFEILDMAVGPEFRRQGMGGELIRCALDWANSAGAKRAHLEVRASNLAARSLYACAGFQVIGRRGRYYHDPDDDALLLMLHLRGTA